MSKGSTQRPRSVAREAFERNWARVFGGERRACQCGEKRKPVEQGRWCARCGEFIRKPWVEPTITELQPLAPRGATHDGGS